MITMTIRRVDVHQETGCPVAILEPRDRQQYPSLVVTLSGAEACSLSHELSLHPTLRSRAFGLLARCLGRFESQIVVIRLLAATAGLASAELELNCPSGTSRVSTEVGQALGLAVALGLPLLAAEELLSPPASEPDRANDAPVVPVSAGVPTAFKRAFE